MRERPILFSAPMVRALLDGTKTQTRRVVNPQPDNRPGMNCTRLIFKNRKGMPLLDEALEAVKPVLFLSLCPYGQPGDRLWVREAIRLVPDPEPDDGTGRVLSTYGADGSLTVADAWPWKRSYLPPMHCPRGLSRIDLEVTDVRVERLQDIGESDCYAEGIRHADVWGDGTAVGFYRTLWEQINGAGSWAANPWVWVMEFRRVQP
jgi:hypothetical protein